MRTGQVEEPEYVLWTYVGRESVFFYPPGSVAEHLVVEHGIESLDVKGLVWAQHVHHGDHLKQSTVRLGAVGSLVSVDHAHEEAA
jgi:hypothetical protein